MVELHALDCVRPQAEDCPRRWGLLTAGRLHSGLGDSAQIADETAGRAVRLPARPGGRQLGQAREPQQPLRHLGLCGEEALPPQPHSLDQPSHEDVGATLLHRRVGGAVELEERLDSLPCLGLDLWAVERSLAGRDHVELAPPRNGRQTRQVTRAKLYRRTGQGPGSGCRIFGVGEHPQPGDRVADLGPLEQRRRSREVEGDAPLLHRRRDVPALANRVLDESADRFRTCSVSDQVLGLPRHRLSLRPLVCALPEADPGVRSRRSKERTSASGWTDEDHARGAAAGALTHPPGARRRLRALFDCVEMIRVVGGQLGEDCSLGLGGLLQLVDHQVGEAGRDLGAEVGRSFRSLLRRRKTSPRSMLPASARMRSWATQSSVSSWSDGLRAGLDGVDPLQ